MLNIVMTLRSVLSLIFTAVVPTMMFIESRAALLFPQNSVFQFTLGTSVPVVMNKKGGLVFSSGYQFNYVLLWNATQLEPIVISARENRDLNLEDTYMAIEDLLDQHGWEDGRECLLRTICELAEAPLHKSGQDFVEEVIHLLLTPSEDSPEAINSSHRSVNKLYREAERLGKSGGDCILAYPNCIESPLESFTDIVFR